MTAEMPRSASALCGDQSSLRNANGQEELTKLLLGFQVFMLLNS